MSISKVFKYYEELPWRIRLHVYGRWQLCPFKRVAARLPERGRLIDIGCGYGLWPFYIHSLHPEMDIWALEVDFDKVQVAKQIAEKHAVRQVEFVAATAQHAQYPPCQIASILDVLYLIPWEEQEQILRKACTALEPGGVLLVKEIGETPAWKYAWNWFEEYLAVRVLKITQGNRFYFRTIEMGAPAQLPGDGRGSGQARPGVPAFSRVIRMPEAALIFNADDFGWTDGHNLAVQRAHTEAS